MKQSTGIISIHPIVAESEELEDVSTEVEWRTDTVNVAQHGERLDRALVDMVPEFSRSYLQQLIDLGLVCLNSQPVRKPSTRVKAADSVTIELRPTPQSQAFKPQNIPLEVVYRDAHILVINKPAGLVVHPAPGNWSGTLLNALLAYDSDIALVPRAGIVHRLDKDTSGLMVVARTRAVMDTLIQAIAARDVSRQYLAVAHGQWSGPNSRTVDAPIGRDPRNRLRMAIVNLASQSGKWRAPTLFCWTTRRKDAWCAAFSTPGARTRFVCTWRRWAIRWWRTLPMVAVLFSVWNVRPCTRCGLRLCTL